MKKLTLIFLAAFIFRLALVFVAYHGDLNNNISWGNSAIERGLTNYYEGKDWAYSAPNQPPLYILLFSLTSSIYKTIYQLSFYLNDKVKAFPSTFIWFWQLKGMVLLVKLPSILADLGIGYLIYKITKKTKLAVLWLFNPIIWYNSAIWGQTDAIVNLLGLISIFYLLRKKLVLGSSFLVLSILFKGSLAIFVPVLFVYALLQNYRFKTWLKSGIVSVIVVILVSVWFHPSVDLFVWLFNLYNSRILPGEIGYLTANAFNFWWLVDPGKVLDSTIYLGLPARIWGYLIAFIGVGVLIFKLKKKISEKTLFWSLAMTALITFLFLTRIHERYLYPFFPVGTILVSFMPEFIIPLLLLSGVNLLNLYHLFWAPPFPPLEALLKVDAFKKLLAVIDTATVGVGLALGKRIKL